MGSAHRRVRRGVPVRGGQCRVLPDTWIWLAVAVGVLCAPALLWWERRVDYPLFVPEIVRRRTFLVPTLVVFMVQFTLGGLLFLNTQYVQLVLGSPP